MVGVGRECLHIVVSGRFYPPRNLYASRSISPKMINCALGELRWKPSKTILSFRLRAKTASYYISSVLLSCNFSFRGEIDGHLVSYRLEINPES